MVARVGCLSESSVRRPPEHRPSASAFTDGVQGRAPLLRHDGRRLVEGTNKLANQIRFKDGLRGERREQTWGWRPARKAAQKKAELEIPDGLRENGVCHDGVHHEFKDSLRNSWNYMSSTLSPARQPRQFGRGSQSSSAPAGPAFPMLQIKDPQFDPPSDLRNKLRVKYGTILGAWRALDPLGHGKLSFFDFCRGTRNLGGIHDVKGLWETLDKNHDGFVGLQDIDPELAWLLQDFKAVLVDSCGSAEAAWQKHFCPTFGHGEGSKGRCAAEPFAQAASNLGYTGTTSAVFRALNVDKASTGISHKDFVLLDKWFHLKNAEGSHGRCGPGFLRGSRSIT